MDKGDHILDKTWGLLDQWEDKRPPRRLKHAIMKGVRPEKKYAWPFHLSPVYSMLVILVLITILGLYLKFDITKESHQNGRDTTMLSRMDHVEITSTDIIAKLEMIECMELLRVLDKLEHIDNLPVAPENNQSSLIGVQKGVQI